MLLPFVCKWWTQIGCQTQTVTCLTKIQVLLINWFFYAGMCAGSVSSMACGTQQQSALTLDNSPPQNNFWDVPCNSTFLVVSQKIIAVKYCKYHVGIHQYAACMDTHMTHLDFWLFIYDKWCHYHRQLHKGY